MTRYHPDLDSAMEQAIEAETEISNDEKTDTEVMHVSPNFQCFFCGGDHVMKSCPEISDLRKMMHSKNEKKSNETTEIRRSYSPKPKRSDEGSNRENQSNKYRNRDDNVQGKGRSVTFYEEDHTRRQQDLSPNHNRENYQNRVSHRDKYDNNAQTNRNSSFYNRNNENYIPNRGNYRSDNQNQNFRNSGANRSFNNNNFDRGQGFSPNRNFRNFQNGYTTNPNRQQNYSQNFNQNLRQHNPQMGQERNRARNSGNNSPNQYDPIGYCNFAKK